MSAEKQVPLMLKGEGKNIEFSDKDAYNSLKMVSIGTNLSSSVSYSAASHPNENPVTN
jgi:hypothetical protein